MYLFVSAGSSQTTNMLMRDGNRLVHVHHFKHAIKSVVMHEDRVIADSLVIKLPSCQTVQTLCDDMGPVAPINGILMLGVSSKNTYGILWRWNGAGYDML